MYCLAELKYSNVLKVAKMKALQWERDRWLTNCQQTHQLPSYRPLVTTINSFNKEKNGKLLEKHAIWNRA